MSETLIGPWRVGLAGDDVATVADLFARVRAADRRAPDTLPGADDSVLLARRGDMLVGLAWRGGADPAELYVDPQHRRRGYGRMLADAVLDQGGIWAHGTLPAAAALAAALGARPVRTMLQLRRRLTGPFEASAPDGVTIRAFVPGRDEDAFLAVNARAFAWHPEQGRLDRAGLAGQMAAEWFDPAGFFLAVAEGGTGRHVDGGDGGRVLGFHWTKVHRVDPTPPPDAARPGPIGEVYVLGVDPRSPVRRLGTPLTLAGLGYLAGRGLEAVMLYVESDNLPALKLYRRLGFADYATDTVFSR